MWNDSTKLKYKKIKALKKRLKRVQYKSVYEEESDLKIKGLDRRIFKHNPIWFDEVDGTYNCAVKTNKYDQFTIQIDASVIESNVLLEDSVVENLEFGEFVNPDLGFRFSILQQMSIGNEVLHSI